MKSLKKVLALYALGLTLTGTNYAYANETISVGATPVPHQEILEFVKPILQKDGIELKIVEFNDYVQPNIAVDNGELDANYLEHRPYLENIRYERNLNLVEAVAVHIEPIGIYSHKIKKLQELKEGALVAIPNDPTNGGRALLLLQQAGLITLTDPNNVTSTPLDIKDNKLKLEFKELDPAQTPRSLDDVDIAIINTNYALDAKLNPVRDAIVLEDSNSPYVNLLVTTKEKLDSKAVQGLVKVLTSPEVKQFIEQKYDGAVVAAF